MAPIRATRTLTRRRLHPTLRTGALAFTLATVTAISAGCIGGGGGETQQISTAGDIPKDTKGTVRVLMEGVPDTAIVKGMLPAFNKAYPGIKVHIQTMTYDQIRDKLVASFQAPEPTYDLIVVDNPWMYDFAKAGFLQPLDGRIKNTPGYDYKDFAAPLRSINDVGGHIYGVPFYNYALGLIYRKDLFSKAGISPPKTLQQLKADAAKLTTAQRAGMAMQPQRGYKIFEEWGNYLFAAGGSIYDKNGKPSLDTPAAHKALRAYIDVYKNSAPKNSLNWAFDEAKRSMSSGKAAMMVSYNWMLPALNKKGSSPLAGKFGLAPIPGGREVLGAWSWAIPDNSNTSDAAWAFISWVTSKQHEKQRVIAGGAPVRTSVLSDPEVRKKGYGAEYYDTVAKLLNNSAPLAEGPNAEELIQAVGTQLNAAVAGQKSVDAALQTAQSDATKIQKE